MGEGPTGSSTSASGAYSASHASLSFRLAASIDRRDATRARFLSEAAVHSTVPSPMCVTLPKAKDRGFA